MAVSFDQIVPWGRCQKEYELMFALSSADMAKGVLDCGGGPASFTAELSRRGYRAVSVDPVYAHGGAAIQARFDATAGPMLAQVRATPDDWTWSYHRNPDDLLATRRSVLETFLGDYGQGMREGRYVAGALPTLPFRSSAFGLALCSHLLFLYSDLLSADFHIQSMRELTRVASEVRVFPLLTLKRKASQHLDAVRFALEADGWSSEVVRVNYELQRGGNQMLRLSGFGGSLGPRPVAHTGCGDSR
jgi:hypothetical protein